MPLPISNYVQKTVTALTKADAKAPIIGAEVCVVAGRTNEAHKRGGITESRERFIEETTGSVVWLWGVEGLNKVGDKVINKVLSNNGNGADVDVGEDALRKPFENFMKNERFNPKKISSKKLSMLKFGKVATSILIANGVMGFVVPPLNHKLTNYFLQKDKSHIVPVPHVYIGDDDPYQKALAEKSKFEAFKVKIREEKDSNNENSKDYNPNFKGGINSFTNFIENTNTGQLLSTDVGVMGGRIYNGRRKQEKIEAFVRDGGSIYFYMWAQPHMRAALNKIESGHWERLDPTTVKLVTEHLETNVLKNGSMSLEEFKAKAFADESVKVDLSRIMGDKDAIPLEEFNSIEKTSELQTRAEGMSKLQPKRMGVSVLSRDQVVGTYQKGEINNPEFLKKAYESYTDGKSSNPNKYVKNQTLVKLKGRINDYMSDICKAAEKNGGVVNADLLKKVKNKNMLFNGINFGAGFAVAVLFLSNLIPKFQYWLTRKMTGVNAFPGVYDYDNQTKTPEKSK